MLASSLGCDGAGVRVRVSPAEGSHPGPDTRGPGGGGGGAAGGRGGGRVLSNLTGPPAAGPGAARVGAGVYYVLSRETLRGRAGDLRCLECSWRQRHQLRRAALARGHPDGAALHRVRLDRGARHHHVEQLRVAAASPRHQAAGQRAPGRDLQLLAVSRRVHDLDLLQDLHLLLLDGLGLGGLGAGGRHHHGGGGAGLGLLVEVLQGGGHAGRQRDLRGVERLHVLRLRGLRDAELVLGHGLRGQRDRDGGQLLGRARRRGGRGGGLLDLHLRN